LANSLSDLASERRRAEAIPDDVHQLTDESLDIYRARLIIQSAKRVAEAYRGAAGSWPWYLELDRGVLPGS
jgi:hypothetical protein